MKNSVISVQYAASGCVTRCAHCARIGRKSESLELADVDLILCRLAAAARDVPGLKIVETPMFELLAHPDPASINELRTKHLGTVDTAISSSGPAIALRDDWQTQLLRLKDLGTETIVVTLHGRDHVHDELVNLRGAYSLTKERYSDEYTPLGFVVSTSDGRSRSIEDRQTYVGQDTYPSLLYENGLA